MMWFRKFSALLLLSLGAALVFLPFPATLEGERTEEAIRLRVELAPFTEQSARTRFGESFTKLSYEGMDGTPEIREAILGLVGQSSSRCVPSWEWQDVLADHGVVDPEGVVYSFRDGLYRILSAEAKDFGAEGELVCFEVAFLGAYDNEDWGPMARLDTGDLEEYPEIKGELERLAAGPIPAESSPDISPRQWRRFTRSEVDSRGDGPDFVVFDRLFWGWITDEMVPWSLQMPWLGKTAMAIGAAFVILGLVLGVGAYRATSARPGIPIASPWLGAFCDVISLVGALIFTVLAIDTLWVGPFGQASLIGLQPDWPSSQPITGLHFVSVLVVFVALPLLTLWFTSLSTQRIEVNDEGVISHGALGSVSMAWQDLERIDLREQKNPFSFTVTDFRSLQKVVKLEGGEHSITINEPGSRILKMEIRNSLSRYAPEAKKSLLEVLAEW